MPALASTKLVMALSTVRSIARPSLYTGTPSSFSACSTSSRNTTCSSVPPGTPRTNTPSGNRSSNPGRTTLRPGAVQIEPAIAQ